MNSFYCELVRDGVLRYSDRVVALALHKAIEGIWNSDDYLRRPLYWAQYDQYSASCGQESFLDFEQSAPCVEIENVITFTLTNVRCY